MYVTVDRRNRFSSAENALSSSSLSDNGADWGGSAGDAAGRMERAGRAGIVQQQQGSTPAPNLPVRSRSVQRPRPRP